MTKEQFIQDLIIKCKCAIVSCDVHGSITPSIKDYVDGNKFAFNVMLEYIQNAQE